MSDRHGRTSSAGLILSLIASEGVISRGELVVRSGLSRTTVSQHLGALMEAGLAKEATDTIRSGGRPSRPLEVNTTFAVALSADIGETHARLAVSDLVPSVIAERRIPLDLRCDPSLLLDQVFEGFLDLVDRAGRAPRDILGIGLGVPAPVDHGTGRVTGPSVMAAWDDYDVGGWFAARIDVPVLVENDVNLMTLSEWREHWPDVAQLVLIKAGTGIGSGIVADGRLYRGAQGVAGDIGHVQLLSDEPPRCRCGKLGCLEARAAGWAIARQLRALGIEAATSRDVLALVRENRPEAIELVRDAGRWIGEVAASAVSVLNPSVLVVGGNLARTDDLLLAGIRERVFMRSLPLATRELQIVRARSDDDAVVLGAARMVIHNGLQTAAVDRTIVAHARTGAAFTASIGIGDVPVPADERASE